MSGHGSGRRLDDKLELALLSLALFALFLPVVLVAWAWGSITKWDY